MEKYYKNIIFHEKKNKKNNSKNPLLYKCTNKLKFHDIDYIIKTNITVKDLGEIGKKHKISLKGKKNDKIYNCYNLLYLKLSVLKIVNCWKKYVYKKIMNMQGPAKYERNKCVNEDDFLTMEKISEINPFYFYSFRDKDNFIYGFNLKSIKQMIDKEQLFNPYNRSILDKDIINELKKRFKLNKIANYNIDNEIKKEQNKINQNINIQIKSKVVELFQKIDDLGYFTNIEWFIKLNRGQHIKFIKELYDIWNYRAGLSFQKKNEICPLSSGNPFNNVNLKILNNRSLLETSLKNISLTIISNFIDMNSNIGNRSVGALYVLSAFTLCSRDVANALPWLYQSVIT